METDELIGPDLVLLLLAAPTKWKDARDRINGITRLEKLLFLVEKECLFETAIQESFEFIPYHYGPYSQAIYEAVELLEEAGLVREWRKSTDSDLDTAEELFFSDTTPERAYERQFVLSEDGESVAEYLAQRNPGLIKRLGELKDKYCGLTLHELIFYVYSVYPKSTERSRIRDDVLGKIA